LVVRGLVVADDDHGQPFGEVCEHIGGGIRRQVVGNHDYVDATVEQLLHGAGDAHFLVLHHGHSPDGTLSPRLTDDPLQRAEGVAEHPTPTTRGQRIERLTGSRGSVPAANGLLRLACELDRGERQLPCAVLHRGTPTLAPPSCGHVGGLVQARVFVTELTLERITDSVALRALRESWERVWRASADRSPFVTWEWVSTWWEHFGGNDRLEVLVALDGETVVGIAPLLRTRLGAASTMLVGIGQENADYGGFLLGERPEETGLLILDYVLDAVAHGVSLNLTRLRPEGDLLPLVRDHVEGRHGKVVLVQEQTTSYPYLDLRAVDDPTAYVNKMDTKNDVRRRTKRLAELHELHFDYDADPTDDNLGAFYELSNRRWDTKDGKMAGLFAGERGRAFITDVTRAMRPTGHVRVSLLRAGDLLVAARFGFECDGAYLGYKECFDPEYSKYGPGQMLTSRILHLEVEQGMHEFDFLRGEGAHKAAWVNAERTVSYWTVHRGGAIGRVRRKLMWSQLRLRLRRWTD